MDPNRAISETVAPTEMLKGNSSTGAPLTSTFFKPSASMAPKVMFCVRIDGLAQDAQAIVCKLQKASDAGGTGVADITGRTITIAAHATNNDNKHIILDYGEHEIDPLKPFVRVHVDAGAVAVAVIIGVFVGCVRYTPVAEKLASTIGVNRR